MRRRDFFKTTLLALMVPVALRFGGGVSELPKPTFESKDLLSISVWVDDRKLVNGVDFTHDGNKVTLLNGIRSNKIQVNCSLGS